MDRDKCSSFRGYKIHKEGEEWLFSDIAEPVSQTWKRRPCGHCKLPNTPEGHDGCIGHLPGVMNACCGHDELKSTYILFAIGLSLRGLIARWIGRAMKELTKRLR